MPKCCDDDDENKHCCSTRHILTLITLLINVGLMLYFVISNVLTYDKYQNRPSFTIYHVPNTTSDYYIIRTDLNDTSNCSRDSLFTFDVRTVYTNIINRHETYNSLFISVFWLSLGVATLLSLFDILISIKSHYCCHDDSDRNNSNSIYSKWFGLLCSQLLQKGSFLFPTYFICIFDFNQLCLLHHTKESLFILHHTYICVLVSVFSMIYLVLWTCACWESHRHEYSDDTVWERFTRCLACHNKIIWIFIIIFLILVVLLIGAYGIFVWITSLMEFFLQTKAILICFHFLFGVFYEIIKSCKH